MSGRLIAFEGIAGSGKTTLAERAAAWLRGHGIDVVELKEPGGTRDGTPAGNAIRSILLDPQHYPDLSPIAQVLGFELDRAITALSLSGPALARGQWVVADRHHFGTIAYQGYGAGLDIGLIDTLNDAAIGGRYPDLSLVFDLPIDLALARQRDRVAMDRFDELGPDYQGRVRAGYRFAASRRGAAAVIVDASKPLDDVFAAVRRAIEPLMKHA